MKRGKWCGQKLALEAWLYRNFAKPIFFKIDPEWIHNQALLAGRILGSNGLGCAITRACFQYRDTVLNQHIWGCDFPNPVGLAAGFDKNAVMIPTTSAVGFGFAEVGSITAKACKGNPKPRLYRLIDSRGIVVNYGLNNEGVDKVVSRLKKISATSIPISVSVAKTNSRDTVKECDGISDYCASLNVLQQAGVGNMYTINISCPNAYGGEPFTTPESLRNLLKEVSVLHIKKPIALKMPVDLRWNEFRSLVEVAIEYGVQSVIIGNLTKDRASLRESISPRAAGGISGKPVASKANELISHTYVEYGKYLKIIGVGGIFSAEDAYEKIKRGASLVQLVTGMIFEGPQLIGQINHGLAQLLRADGYKNISEAIGAKHCE